MDEQTDKLPSLYEGGSGNGTFEGVKNREINIYKILHIDHKNVEKKSLKLR